MNSINHNSELSNFSNCLRKDPLNSLNFNDYQYDNPNSPSLSFPYLNQYSLTSNHLEKVESEIKLDENVQAKDQTIGFNHLQGFLENSMQYPFDEFKNAKIKKPQTFQFNQGYLNALTEPADLCREQHEKKEQEKKLVKGKGKRKQNLRNSGDINQDNQQKQNLIKLEDLVLNQTPKSNEHFQKAFNTEEGPFYGESCLQNLKSIAKIAFEEIRKHKNMSYQSIATNLLVEISRQSAVYDDYHSNKHEKASVSSQGKSSKKSQIIQNMIKNKSFGQIKQMNQIQEDSNGTKTKKKYPKYENEDNDDQDDQKEPGKNIKNIRRRLYDAINVMLAANVIEKRQRGSLSVKSVENSRGRKMLVKSREQDQSFDDLQKKIEEKRRAIEAKRKYRQFLGARSLLLQKHIEKNKSVNQKTSKKQQKLWFPLVFVNLQLPMKLSIESNAKSVEIQSLSQLDINCQLDLLGLLYWIERDQIAKKQEELETKAERQRVDQEEEVAEKKKGHKKVKIAH